MYSVALLCTLLVMHAVTMASLGLSSGVKWISSMQKTEYPSKCDFDLVFGSGVSVRVVCTLTLSASCQKEPVHENLDANPYVLGIYSACW